MKDLLVLWGCHYEDRYYIPKVYERQLLKLVNR